MKSWTNPFGNDKGSWTNPHPDGSVDTLPWLVLFVLLLIILNPIMYMIGKSDGRADAYLTRQCTVSEAPIVIPSMIIDNKQVQDAVLEAKILLDRIEREHGIVCDGGVCTVCDGGVCTVCDNGVCTKTDPVTP